MSANGTFKNLIKKVMVVGYSMALRNEILYMPSELFHLQHVCYSSGIIKTEAASTLLRET